MHLSVFSVAAVVPNLYSAITNLMYNTGVASIEIGARQTIIYQIL